MLNWIIRELNGSNAYFTDEHFEAVIYLSEDGEYILSYTDFWSANPSFFNVNIRYIGADEVAVAELKKYAEKAYSNYVHFKSKQEMFQL